MSAISAASDSMRGENMWYVENNRLVHDELPEAVETIMSEPYPPFWWHISNGLVHTNLPLPIETGAFYGCSVLKKVYIPESVKYIGEYAFAETALTNVRIASDCVYYDTSFPEGCSISFYA